MEWEEQGYKWEAFRKPFSDYFRSFVTKPYKVKKSIENETEEGTEKGTARKGAAKTQEYITYYAKSSPFEGMITLSSEELHDVMQLQEVINRFKEEKEHKPPSRQLVHIAETDTLNEKVKTVRDEELISAFKFFLPALAYMFTYYHIIIKRLDQQVDSDKDILKKFIEKYGAPEPPEVDKLKKEYYKIFPKERPPTQQPAEHADADADADVELAPTPSPAQATTESRPPIGSEKLENSQPHEKSSNSKKKKRSRTRSDEEDVDAKKAKMDSEGTLILSLAGITRLNPWAI